MVLLYICAYLSTSGGVSRIFGRVWAMIQDFQRGIMIGQFKSWFNPFWIQIRNESDCLLWMIGYINIIKSESDWMLRSVWYPKLLHSCDVTLFFITNFISLMMSALGYGRVYFGEEHHSLILTYFLDLNVNEIYVSYLSWIY